MGRLNPNARNRGFTLLECLIALLVVGLVMGGSLFQVSRYADERAELSSRLDAHTLAWNKLMDQYQLIQGWVQPNAGLAEASGVTAVGGRDWRWEIEATSTIAQDFYRYEVSVYESASDSEQSSGDLAALLVAYFIAEQ